MSSLTTHDDLANPFKDTEVQKLDGSQQEIRLAAPPWRAVQRALQKFSKSRDPSCVIRACLPRDRRAQKCLDRLTPESAWNVENVAFALVLGERLVKRSLAAAWTMSARAT